MLLLFEHISHLFSSVSIADFEQVSIGWESCLFKHVRQNISQEICFHNRSRCSSQSSALSYNKHFWLEMKSHTNLGLCDTAWKFNNFCIHTELENKEWPIYIFGNCFALYYSANSYVTANDFWLKILHNTNNKFSPSIVTLEKLINVPCSEFKNSLEALNYLCTIISLVAFMVINFAY